MSAAGGPVGIPWYRKRDYERIRAIMADQALLPRSYDTWRARAEVLEDRLRATGRHSARTLIEPKTFARWCSANRLKTNAYARLMYVEQAFTYDPRQAGA